MGRVARFESAREMRAESNCIGPNALSRIEVSQSSIPSVPYPGPCFLPQTICHSQFNLEHYGGSSRPDQKVCQDQNERIEEQRNRPAAHEKPVFGLSNGSRPPLRLDIDFLLRKRARWRKFISTAAQMCSGIDRRLPFWMARNRFRAIMMPKTAFARVLLLHS